MNDLYGGQKPSILIKSILDIIHEPGEVFEVRIPKTKAGTIAGYFDDTAKAAAAIARENGKHTAVYATVNPVKAPLLSRNENKLQLSQFTTTDSEIDRRRWFLLDFDPKRPAGISSTDGEMALAVDRAEEVVEWLSSIGWPEPLRAESGNGAHLMYRVDEPNDDLARIDFEMALKMIASVWSDSKTEVDVTVFNASRVWKVYGTISMKGSDTVERPHRLANITKVPAELVCVSRALIENIARPLRDAKSDEFKDMTGEFIGDMVKWLADRGQTVTSGPRPMFGNEGQKWTISKCPFDGNHKDPMVGLVNNRPVFRCLHNSCSAYRWKEYREKIDPTYKDPETVTRRLGEWCNGETDDIDPELVQSAAATGNKLPSILKQLRKDAPRARVLLLEAKLKDERRRYLRETIGENNEKGNIVGLINRTRSYQSEGLVPMYWIADYDHRIRAGQVGDIECPKASESDEISLMIKFHSSGDSWVKQSTCAQVIKHLAEEYRVNPLRVFLKAKRWDGTKRIDDWLPHYMGTKDDDYTRAIGRKWLISGVARAMDPGCQVDHMLIFEGTQGVGKSQALRIIGGQFYTEYAGSTSAGLGQKDMVHVILGKMVVEMSELAAVRKSDIESLKAMLTTCTDDVRLSYERDAKSYPRTCIFAGTTNEIGRAYIADITGARRFWPTLVGDTHPVRTDLLRQDVDQLWAEAVEAYEAGEDWHTVPKELVSAEQADRQMSLEDSDPWFGRIRHSLTDPDSFAGNVFYIREEFVGGQPTGEFVVRSGQAGAILGIVLGVDTARQGPQETARVQNILRAIGFKKVRPNGKWMGGTYAYDLKRDAVPHLWSSIDAARKQTKFPKQIEEEAD